MPPRRSKPIALWLLASVCLAPIAARAEPSDAPSDDWPFLRGPHYDGRSAETGLADSWPAAGPPVLWSRELGQGYSGFVAWGDRIATQYQTLGGQYVVCMEANTGRTLWEYRYGWSFEPAGVYPGPRATPTYYEGRIYYAGPRGTVGCLDAADGRSLWTVDIHEQFDGKGTEFGYSCSPTVLDGKVILPVGGPGASMVALDALDGSVVWRSGDDAASYAPAYPIVFQGRRLVLGYLQNALVCHDLETGERIWRHALSSGYNEHSAWPIYVEPHLWISSPFRTGCELLELTGRPDSPVRTVWRSDLMSNDILSSVLVDGAVFGFDLREAQAKVHRPSRGQFRSIDFDTGRELWSTGSPKPVRSLTPSQSDVGQRIGHATVLYADGKLILINDLGELILARASREKYEELGRVSILGGEICWTQPTLHRRRLFARNQTSAVCVYLGNPDLLAPEARATAVTAADIPQGEYFDLAALILGVEPEYAFDIPSGEWLRTWFLVSLFGILGAAMLAALAARFVLGNRLSPDAARWVFWTTAFLLGAAGTTAISNWTGDFVFTWPVCLFVAFDAAASEIRLPGQPRAGGWARWRGRLLGGGFVAVCVAYFVLCRRLSLVFEWVFLCGFAAAVPLVLAGTYGFRNRRGRAVWRALMTAAAFAAFYWSAVVVLWFKSRL